MAVEKTYRAGTGFRNLSITPAGSSGQLQFNNAGAFGGAAATAYSASGTHLTITAQSAAIKPLVLKGAASPTANLLELQNSAGTVLTAFKPTGVLNLPAYTVATLPAGVAGDRCYVTNALAPVFLAALVGGGAITCPAFHNGTTWVAA